MGIREKVTYEDNAGIFSSYFADKDNVHIRIKFIDMELSMNREQVLNLISCLIAIKDKMKYEDEVVSDDI